MKAKIFVSIVCGIFLLSPLKVIAECDHLVDMPDSWCCPSEAKKFACWAILGKPGGEEVCYSMGCNPQTLEWIKRDRKEKKKKENLEETRRQTEFNKKKAQEESNRRTQEKFNETRQQILEQQKFQDYLNQQKKEERDRELEIQKEESRHKNEQQKPENNNEILPSPSGSPKQEDSECDENGIKINSAAWKSLTERQKESLLSLKKDFDTWNRNFPNRFKPYPWQWLQWFCQ